MPGSNSRPNVSEGYEVPLSYRGDRPHCDAPITRVGVMYSTWSTLRLGTNPLKFTVKLIARYIQAVVPCRSNRCSLVGTGVPPLVEKDTPPSGPIFKPELLNNEEGTQHKTALSRKALARRDDSSAAFGTLILSAGVFGRSGKIRWAVTPVAGRGRSR